MTLDYRSPTTGRHRVERIMAEIANTQSLGLASVFLKIAFGVPLCLLGPFVVTVLAKGIELKWDSEALPGFLSTFILSAVILIPILMWLERRSRGQFLLDGLAGESPASSYGEFEWQSTRVFALIYTEFALLGPRLVWSALDAIRGRSPMDEELRFIAARVVLELLDLDSGVPTQQLFQSVGCSQQRFQQAVQWLAGNDWLGVSRKRDRVWMNTAARARLESL